MDDRILAEISENRRHVAGVSDVAAALARSFDDLGITVRVFEHPAVYTVEESKALRGRLEGAHLKNLLLRNKKNELWLLCALEDTPVDMKVLAERLKSGRLSFANAEQMQSTLGVQAGAVSPFAVINDVQRLVRVVLEQRVLECGLLNFHPLRNDATATIGRDDFLRFLEAHAHNPILVKLD